MLDNLFELSAVAVACIPIVVGLVGIANLSGLNKRYAPILSLLLGIGAVLLTGAQWQFAVAQGIIVGLSASGLYSSAKKLTE